MLGIGVNANQTGDQLPADTPTEPTSLRLELGHAIDRAHLLAAILQQLEAAYDLWVARETSASG